MIPPFGLSPWAVTRNAARTAGAARYAPSIRLLSTLKIRESDPLPLAEPVDAPRSDGQVAEDYDALAAKLVANWPEVPEERKAEIGRLLAGP